MNISKELLFKTLEIENTEDYIRRTINKLNGKIEQRSEKNKFIESLTIKAIKFKLNWLFNSWNRIKKWKCEWNIDNEHVVSHWPKTRKWREKWSRAAKEITNKELLKTLLYKYEDKKNFERVAKLINDSIEELVKEYLI